ncbi:hypothetical protein [Vibrio jasicida]|uniref:hypothetical protein n=1 Tax=Vibrio jasicida TaxID=766224 RepID=UPI000CE4A865|nr:hypothetical protein [Vibrio jasicida]
MSFWILVPFLFIHLGLGGLIAFGLVFLVCAERRVSISKFNNDVCVALWFAYSISIFASVVLFSYYHLTNGQASYYFWLAMPWAVLVVLITYWNATAVKVEE